MIILGVDPGTIVTGFGIIRYHNNEISCIDAGCIIPPKIKEISPRLETIYNELDKIIKKHKPDEFALETAFYGKNVQSTLKIGYARGIALLAASHNKLVIAEYSPREIKKSVVGSGSSTKEQVQYMIRGLLNLKNKKMKLDESDALAVALCHAFKKNSHSHKSGSWKKFIESNPDRIIK